MATPDLDAVKAYLGQSAASKSDETISGALAAETSAQARVCRVGNPMQTDLAEALCRRVARNLAMRGVPLGVINDAEGSTSVGFNDPEIRRLEKPYRKLVQG